MKKLGLLFMVALLSLSFTNVTRGYAQGQKVVRITLIDENGSGEDGSAQITDQSDGTVKVELIMMNAPEGAVQPAHIHKGSCATLDPNPAFPLESIKEGKSTSTVKTTLADLTKEKYAINVHESAANIARYVSCGNLPSAAVASGGTMTMDQVMSTLLDQATELEATAKKKEADASKNAYVAFHATFAAHENDIKAKDAASQTSIEDAMRSVNDALGKGDFDAAGVAGDKLVEAVKGARGKMMGSTGAMAGSSTSTMSLNDAIKQMQSQTQDVVREIANKDKDGSQRAYDAFHTTFAANEDAIKAKNPEAQSHIETAMREVRDAVAAGDFAKASTAAGELQKEVNDAAGEMGMSSTPSGSTTGSNISGGMMDTLKQLQSNAADLVRETSYNDKDGSQRAYDAFHTTFAANEDAIKAKNPEAQSHIETAMREVRDAVAAGDLKKANTASNELVNEINDATREMSATSNPSNDAMPGTGSGDMPVTLWALVLGALALTCSGLWVARKAERK